MSYTIAENLNKNNSQNNWDIVPLSSLCLRTATTDPTKNPESSFKYVDVSSISNELWQITAATPCTGATAPSRARKPVKKQDVIFATVRPTLKRVAIVPEYLDGQIVSTAFCILRADPQKADPHFIYYSLLTNDFISRMENIQRGASYPAVTDSDILKQEIPVPPLPEQRAITGILSKIQAAMEVQDKIVTTLKELKAATMAKIFREGLHGEPLKQTEIGEIPESWEVIKVGSLLKLCSGESRPHGLSQVYSESTPYPVYGGNGIMGYSSQFLTSRESIVIGRVGAYSGSVHVCPPYSWVTDNALYHRDPISEKALLQYLAELLSYLRLNRLQRKGAQPLVTQGIVHNLEIPLPSKAEQEEIVGIATPLKKQCEVAEDKLEALKSLFSSMLHLLMTGQLQVNGLQIKEVNG